MKLLNTKKWFTIDDTARYLSLKFDETVTTRDILQFVLDGYLKLSWVLNNRSVIKVLKGENLYLNLDDSKTYSATGEVPDPYKHYQDNSDENYFFNVYSYQGILEGFAETFAKQTHISKSIKSIGKPFVVTGVFNFDLSEGAIDARILSLVTKDDRQWISLDGFVLVDDKGELMSPIDMFYNTVDKDCFESPRNHHPTDSPPSLNELVIKRDDLNQFEDYVIGNTNNKQISQSTEISYLKIIGALVALLKMERTRKYTQGNIQDKLESQYSEGLGIKSFSKSNLEKIFSKASQTLKDN